MNYEGGRSQPGSGGGAQESAQRSQGVSTLELFFDLVATAALWWAYFVGDDEAAAENFAAKDEATRSGWAARGYDLTHLLMTAGVIAIAAGTRLGLPDLLAPAGRSGAVLIAVGAALYLTWRSPSASHPAMRRVISAG